MKNWVKIVLIILYTAGIIAGFLFINCGTNRSPLLKDENLPYSCKMELECNYFHQKSAGKSSCVVVHGIRCVKALDYVFCKKQHPENKDKETLCQAFMK